MIYSEQFPLYHLHALRGFLILLLPGQTWLVEINFDNRFNHRADILSEDLKIHPERAKASICGRDLLHNFYHAPRDDL